MKVSIDLKSVKDTENNIKSSLEKVIKNHALLNELADVVIKDIQVQTRMGKSIPLGGQPFKPLSQKPHPFLFGVYGALETKNTAATKKGFGRKQSNAVDVYDADGYSYTDIRDSISRATTTHKAFSPKRSNLTITGQLLDSLKSVIVGTGRFIIQATGVHEPYNVKQLFGGSRTIGKKIYNSILAQHVANQGRPFIGVRKELIPRLKRIIIGYVRRSSNVRVKRNNKE